MKQSNEMSDTSTRSSSRTSRLNLPRPPVLKSYGHNITTTPLLTHSKTNLDSSSSLNTTTSVVSSTTLRLRSSHIGSRFALPPGISSPRTHNAHVVDNKALDNSRILHQEETKKENDDITTENFKEGTTPTRPKANNFSNLSPIVKINDSSPNEKESASLDAIHNSNHDDELPDGWAEVIDPGSGNFYYVNSMKGLTQWERPMNNNTITVDTNDITEINNSAVDVTNETSTTTIESSEVKIVEKEDIVTKNDIAEISMNVVVQEDPIQDMQQQQESLLLSSGWTTAIYEATGQIYYYHAESGQTSWELPVVTTNEQQQQPIEIEHQSQVDGYKEDESVVDVQRIQLKEVEDELKVSDEYDSKQNNEQLISSLEVSKIEESVVDPSLIEDKFSKFDTNVANSILDAVEDETITNDEKLTTSLLANETNFQPETEFPDGWVEVRSDETDVSYYYNEITGITQWEHPGVSLNETTTNITSVSKDHNESNVAGLISLWEATTNTNQSSNFIPPKNVMDEATAILHHQAVVEEEIVSVSQEIQPVFPADHMEVENTNPDIYNNISNESENNVEALPYGWIELLDVDSGETYYLHEASGVSQWERPNGDIVRILDKSNERIELEVSEIDNGNILELSHDTTLENVDVLPERTEFVSETMLNTETIDSNFNISLDNEDQQNESLTKNNSSFQPETETASLMNSITYPLLSGWIEIRNDETDVPYYFNKITGITQWEHPAMSLVEATTNTTSLSEDPNESNVAGVTTVVEATTSSNQSANNDAVEESQSELSDFIPPNNFTDEAKDILDQAVVEEEIVSVSQDSEIMDPTHENTNPDISNNISRESENVAEALPLGWVELLDLDSGLTFYLHEVSGASQWERPNGDIVGVIDESKERIESEVSQTYGNSLEPQDMALENVDVLPERTEITSEMGLLPTSETDDFASSKSLETESSGQNAGNLPSGWIEAVDESSGMTYFYCEINGVTQWERPLEDSQLIGTTRYDETLEQNSLLNEEPTLVTRGQMESLVADTDQNETPLEYEKTDETLFSDFEDAQQPPNPMVNVCSDGDDQFQSEAVNVGDQIVDQNNGSLITDQGNSPEDILPDGWTQLIDEASGEPYYFREIDSMVQWERPSATVVNYDSANQDNLEMFLSQEEEQETNQTRTFENDSTIVSLSQQEKLSSDQTDVSPYQSEPVNGGYQIVDQTNDILVADESKPRQDNLPEGWTQLIDDASGDPYYVRESDCTIQWEHPSLTVDYDIDNQDNSEILLLPEEKLKTDQTKTLLENGAEVISLKQELNKVSNHSGTSTYVAPTPISQEEEENIELNDKLEFGTPEQNGDIQLDGSFPEVNKDDIASSYLPEGWTQLIEETTGMPYYYCQIDGTTHRHLPATVNVLSKMSVSNNVTDAVDPNSSSDGLANVSTSVDADISARQEVESPENDLKNETNDINPDNIEMDGKAPYDSDTKDGYVTPINNGFTPFAETSFTNTSEEEKLPHGWVQLVDESSGSPYFYNEIENRTQWISPLLQQQTPNKLDDDDIFLDSEDTDPVGVESITQEQLAQEGSDGKHGMLVEQFEQSHFDVKDTALLSDTAAGTNYVSVEKQAVRHVSSDDRIEGHDATDFQDQVMLDSDVKEHSKHLPQSDIHLELPVKHPSESILPEGWIQMFDENSGVAYYYNETEDRTQWEFPTERDNKASHSEIDEAAIVDHVGNSDQNSHMLENLDLPPGWTIVTDEGTGMPYYLFEADGTTQWEFPTVSSSSISDVDLIAYSDVNPDILPHVETYDDPRRHIYHSSAVDQTMQSARTGLSKEHRKVLEKPPLRAFGIFGFGGRLCVYQPGRSSRLTILRSHMLLSDEKIVRIETEKQKFAICAPLNACDDSAVHSYIEQVSSYDDCLLWKLTRIARDSSGKLRSNLGVVDDESPESKTVRLLLEGHVNEPFSSPNVKHDDKIQEGGFQKHEEIVKLVLKGLREEAATEAVKAKNYAMAFLVGLRCSLDVFQYVGKEFASDSFGSGHPLRTVSMLFSGNLRSDTALDFWESTDPGSLKMRWRENLAAIISNRTNDWEHIVVALGDTLLSIGEVVPAHFCYMVSGCPVTSPLRPESRLTLLGCDVTALDFLLVTDNALQAFQLTEAYEWAKRRGNQKAVISSLISFKLVYAWRLADFGFRELATEYLASVVLVLGASEDDLRNLPSPGKPFSVQLLSSKTPALLGATLELQHRLMPQNDKQNQLSFWQDDDADVSFVTVSANDVDVTMNAEDVSVDADGISWDLVDDFDTMKVPEESKLEGEFKSPSQDVVPSFHTKQVISEPKEKQMHASLTAAAVITPIKQSPSSLSSDAANNLVSYEKKSLPSDVTNNLVSDEKKFNLVDSATKMGSMSSKTEKVAKKPPAAPISAPAKLERSIRKAPTSGGCK